MGWWFPDTGLDLGRYSSASFFLLNYISVRGFGEAEYWFSLIKVATVIFIIVGVAMIIGILKVSSRSAGATGRRRAMRLLLAVAT